MCCFLYFQGLLEATVFRFERALHINCFFCSHINKLYDNGGKCAVPFSHLCFYFFTQFFCHFNKLIFLLLIILIRKKLLQASWLYQSSQLMTSLKRAQLRQQAKNRQNETNAVNTNGKLRPKTEWIVTISSQIAVIAHECNVFNYSQNTRASSLIYQETSR